MAIADQGRASRRISMASMVPPQTLPLLYQMSSSAFHDIATGSNQSYRAGPGYDLVTGRGSPIADRVLDGFDPPVTIPPLTANINGRTELIYVSDDYANRGLMVTTTLGNADGTFAPAKVSVLGDGPALLGHRVLVADENHDGVPNLVFTFEASDGLHVRTAMGKGDGTFSPTVQTVLGDGPAVLSNPVLVADENHDSMPNLVFTFEASDGLYIRTALGKGNEDLRRPHRADGLGRRPGRSEQSRVGGRRESRRHS